MKSDISIPFRHGFVTNLSLITQEWPHSSQELSATLQSIAETGNQQSCINWGSMSQTLASFVILLVANLVLLAFVALAVTLVLFLPQVASWDSCSSGSVIPHEFSAYQESLVKWFSRLKPPSITPPNP